MQSKSILHSSMAIFSLKNLSLWRDSNPDLLVFRRTRDHCATSWKVLNGLASWGSGFGLTIWGYVPTMFSLHLYLYVCMSVHRLKIFKKLSYLIFFIRYFRIKANVKLTYMSGHRFNIFKKLSYLYIFHSGLLDLSKNVRPAHRYHVTRLHHDFYPTETKKMSFGGNASVSRF
jgi:hypothetical protein